MDMPQNEDSLPRTKRWPGKGIVALLVVVVGLGAIANAPLLVRSMPEVAAVISAVLVELTNNDRTTSGLGTLAQSPTLTAVAQAKADDMAVKGYFAHTSPEGVTPWHWFSEAGYKFSYAGENLAVDFSESDDVERAWMNSPTHRANIVGTQFTEIGIATANGTYQGRPTTFVVQEFGTTAPGEQGLRTEPSSAPAPEASTKSSPKPKPVPVATTTPPRVVRDVVLSPAPETVALATTLPTTTPIATTLDTILGESAGAYLANSTSIPWWYRIFYYFF